MGKFDFCLPCCRENLAPKPRFMANRGFCVNSFKNPLKISMFYSCVGLKILLLQYKYFRQLINHNYGSLLSKHEQCLGCETASVVLAN